MLKVQCNIINAERRDDRVRRRIALIPYRWVPYGLV